MLRCGAINISIHGKREKSEGENVAKKGGKERENNIYSIDCKNQLTENMRGDRVYLPKTILVVHVVLNDTGVIL